MMSLAFRLLATVTAVSAYLQIAFGGVVRTSASGLGCQDQWPLCNGQPYPGWEVHAVIEYAHRTFGAVSSVLMLVTFIAAVAVFRRRRPMLAWTSGAALLVVSLEIPLGALVVFRDLSGVLVLAHLAVAMTILGLLVATAVLAHERTEPGVEGTRVRVLLGGVAAIAFLALLTGAGVVASEADEQCHAWPLCASGLQFDFTGVNAFAMGHRLTALALFLAASYVAWRAWREASRTAGAWAVATVLVIVAEAAIGAGAALAHDSVVFDSLHVAVAAAAWGAATTAAMVSLQPQAPTESSANRSAASGVGRTKPVARSSAP